MEGWWRWALVRPCGVASSQMVSVSASVNVFLHHKVQKFSSGTGSPGWSRKKGHKTVVWWWCKLIIILISRRITVFRCDTGLSKRCLQLHTVYYGRPM